MATQKAIKLQEDTHRKHLEETIITLAKEVARISKALEELRVQQVEMLEMMRRMTSQQASKRRNPR